MKSGIYMIICVESNKVYIGQTVNLTKRFKQHLYDLRRKKHANIHMVNAFEKYGENAFEFSILEMCEKSKLNEREEFWINHHDSRNYEKGFNKVIGPYKGLGIKKYDCPEFKEMMSQKQKEKWNDASHKEKCIESIQKAHAERKARGETLSILTEESKRKSRESCSTPEFIKELSERGKKQLEDPEQRSIALRTLEAGRNNPLRLENLRKAKQDPEYKKMMAEKTRLSWIKRREKNGQ